MSKFKRMSDYESESIVLELNKWAQGMLGSKLTWAILEDKSGFSRQTLQAKPAIKAAYDLAKSSLSGGLAAKKNAALKDSGALQVENQQLRTEIESWRKKEKLWQLRWQRIAFNIRNSGMQMVNIDRDIPQGAKPLSDKESAKVLAFFDKDIPTDGKN